MYSNKALLICGSRAAAGQQQGSSRAAGQTSDCRTKVSPLDIQSSSSGPMFWKDVKGVKVRESLTCDHQGDDYFWEKGFTGSGPIINKCFVIEMEQLAFDRSNFSKELSLSQNNLKSHFSFSIKNIKSKALTRKIDYLSLSVSISRTRYYKFFNKKLFSTQILAENGQLIFKQLIRSYKFQYRPNWSRFFYKIMADEKSCLHNERGMA